MDFDAVPTKRTSCRWWIVRRAWRITSARRSGHPATCSTRLSAPSSCRSSWQSASTCALGSRFTVGTRPGATFVAGTRPGATVAGWPVVQARRPWRWCVESATTCVPLPRRPSSSTAWNSTSRTPATQSHQVNVNIIGQRCSERLWAGQGSTYVCVCVILHSCTVNIFRNFLSLPENRTRAQQVLR